MKPLERDWTPGYDMDYFIEFRCEEPAEHARNKRTVNIQMSRSGQPYKLLLII